MFYIQLRTAAVRTSMLLVSFLLLAACGGSGDPGLSQRASVTEASAVIGQSSMPSMADVGTAEGTSQQAAVSVYQRPKPALPIPTPMVGVTLNSISNLSSTITSLKSISRTPTTRIVFDEFVSASTYRNAMVKIRDVSYIMGEILDSYYVKQYSVQDYLNRTREYVNTLGDIVDIWEVGNEINGEWLGRHADVVAKMTGAYDIVKNQGKITEVTLYYNKNCWANPANEMFTWAKNNIPDRMKQGLDYVLVSYYEEDCNGLKPDWPTVFKQLSTMFPNSKIGFGEVGVRDSAQKAEYLTRYYTMKIGEPNYIGGHFWWYFKQDMVPNTKPLLQTLNNAITQVSTSPTLAPTPTPTPTLSIVALTDANWNTVYNGYGYVNYDSTGITLSPMASTSAGETHAALSLANLPKMRNFKLSITANTTQQLRQGTAPNPWEVFWIFFNYNPRGTGKDTNYFMLKPNGVELGKAYDELGQTFLYTGGAQVQAVGAYNKFDIEKVGNRVIAYINGVKTMDYTGAVIDVPGSIGLYSEDARVHITDVKVTILP